MALKHGKTLFITNYQKIDLYIMPEACMRSSVTDTTGTAISISISGGVVVQTVISASMPFV